MSAYRRKGGVVECNSFATKGRTCVVDDEFVSGSAAFQQARAGVVDPGRKAFVTTAQIEAEKN